MHYALTFRGFLSSHYFFTGLRVATGVIGLTLLALTVGSMPVAMTVSIGALSASLMDLPSPLRHKFNEMLASVLLCTAVTLIVGLCSRTPVLLGMMVVVMSFLASLMVAYGQKTLPLQFAALFAMTLSMANELPPLQALYHAAIFLGGGLAYVGYSMAVSWFLRHRTRQQILAEALFALARYIGIKADMYDVHVNLTDQFNLLVRQQILLADRQQASRDLLLRGKPEQRDAALLHVHYSMLDLYELILTTHTDYALLRQQFADTDLLDDLRALVARLARDLESVAYAVSAGDAVMSRADYRLELDRLDRNIAALAPRAARDPAFAEPLAILRASAERVRAAIALIDRMVRATQGKAGPLPDGAGADLTPFLTQQKYELRLLRSHLRRDSPIFRFACRVALAVSFGLLIAGHLPYASHGYWIVLTIVIILKPSFSMTRKRRADRLAGTVIGCILTAVILHFVHRPSVLLVFLFVASVAVPSFVFVKYRYAAIGATMQILLQLNLLLPETSGLISERLVDTAIGAVVATFFSFVLPSWEYRALPRLIQAVLRANQLYIAAGEELMRGQVPGDFHYRLSRKRLMDSLAGLSAALGRMLDEPASKHYSADEINRFIVQNYLVMAHVAAIRLLLRKYHESLPQEAVNAFLEAEFGQVKAMLAQAQGTVARLLGVADGTEPAAADGPSAVAAMPAPSDAGTWSGWRALQRRVALLREDARKIALSSVAIERELRGV